MPPALLLFLAAAQLAGQPAGGLAGRIENAPLKADQGDPHRGRLQDELQKWMLRGIEVKPN